MNNWLWKLTCIVTKMWRDVFFSLSKLLIMVWGIMNIILKYLAITHFICFVWNVDYFIYFLNIIPFLQHSMFFFKNKDVFSICFPLMIVQCHYFKWFSMFGINFYAFDDFLCFWWFSMFLMIFYVFDDFRCFLYSLSLLIQNHGQLRGYEAFKMQKSLKYVESAFRRIFP